MSELVPSQERHLWFDGPNYAADAVIIDTEKQSILLIQRSDCGEWALPGGFINDNESALEAARREANEETATDLSCTDGVTIYHGIVDDPRNSEQSWIETTAYLFPVSMDDIHPLHGDDATLAKWVALTDLPSSLYGSHAAIITRSLDYLQSKQTIEAIDFATANTTTVSGGHMGYATQILHDTTGRHFIKSHVEENFTDEIRRQHSLEYLQKEARIMAHLRSNNLAITPAYSHLTSGNNLIMEAFATTDGWMWRAPKEHLSDYIEDCFKTFHHLEACPIFPDASSTIEPSMSSFLHEGWHTLTNKPMDTITKTTAPLAHNFRPETKMTLEQLIKAIPRLKQLFYSLPTQESAYVLCHHDARQSNIAWHPKHGARLIDWSWAGYGVPGSDKTNLLIDLHKSGHDITPYLEHINIRHCLTLVGFWLEHATWPPRDGDMTVRQQQLLSAISGYATLRDLIAEKSDQCIDTIK